MGGFVLGEAILLAETNEEQGTNPIEDPYVVYLPTNSPQKINQMYPNAGKYAIIYIYISYIYIYMDPKGIVVTVEV